MFITLCVIATKDMFRPFGAFFTRGDDKAFPNSTFCTNLRHENKFIYRKHSLKKLRIVKFTRNIYYSQF